MRDLFSVGMLYCRIQLSARGPFLNMIAQLTSHDIWLHGSSGVLASY